MGVYCPLPSKIHYFLNSSIQEEQTPVWKMEHFAVLVKIEESQKFL
jgi:hypothetical protein